MTARTILRTFTRPFAKLRELTHSDEDVADLYPAAFDRSSKEAGLTSAVSGMAQASHTGHISL